MPSNPSLYTGFPVLAKPSNYLVRAFLIFSLAIPALCGQTGRTVAEAVEPPVEIQISLDKSLVFAYVGDQAEFVLTITNPGEESLEVSGIEFLRNGLPDVAENFSGGFEGSIAPGGSVEVPMLFSPVCEGWFQFTTIRVLSNATAGVSTVSLHANSSPPGFQSVIHGNGTILALAGGTVPVVGWSPAFTSEDGAMWEPVRDLPAAHAVAFGGGRFVSVNGRGPIRSSEDGRSWTVRLSEPGHELIGVRYLQGKFYAFGPEGVGYRSTDGVDWEELTPQAVNLRDLAVFDDRFVGVALGKIVLSDDLVIWETQPFQEAVSRVMANEESLVAMGRNGVIHATTDLAAWQTYASSVATMLTDIIFHEGSFIALGFAFGEGLGVAVKLTSADGVTWEEESLNNPNILTSLTATGDGLTFVGRRGATLSSHRETDERHGRRGASMTFNGVASDGETLIVAGEGGLIWKYTGDGKWLGRQTGTPYRLWDVIHADERFVAVGDRGAIRTSLTGDDWTSVNVDTFTGIFGGVTFGEGGFLAVGENGTLARSSDGEAWTLSASGSDQLLWGVTTGAAGFVAVGEMGTVLFSDNGESWQPCDVDWDQSEFPWQPAPPPPPLYSVAYAAPGYVAVGGAGEIVHSSDGLIWERQESGVTGMLERVRFAGGRYVVGGDEGVVLTSFDGQSWRREALGTEKAIFGVSENGPRVLFAGDGETLIERYLGPIIHQHPQSATVDAGAEHVFHIQAEGVGDLTYDWRLDGEVIPASNAPSLALSQVDRVFEGTYTTLVSDAEGATESLPAKLTVRLTLENWLRQAGYIGEDASPEEIWEAARATGDDGLPRLLHYALPGKPGDPLQQVAVRDEMGEKYLTLAFTRLKPPHDLIYRIEAGNSLDLWAPLDSPQTQVLESSPEEETVLVVDEVPLSERGDQHFLRIQVSLQGNE